jgi:hypothetical protein
MQENFKTGLGYILPWEWMDGLLFVVVWREQMLIDEQVKICRSALLQKALL